MSRRYRLVHDAFETEGGLVVRHVFYGDSVAEVMAVYAAHRRADSFIRQCDDKGSFGGRFQCSTRYKIVVPGESLPPET